MKNKLFISMLLVSTISHAARTPQPPKTPKKYVYKLRKFERFCTVVVNNNNLTNREKLDLILEKNEKYVKIIHDRSNLKALRIRLALALKEIRGTSCKKNLLDDFNAAASAPAKENN